MHPDLVEHVMAPFDDAATAVRYARQVVDFLSYDVSRDAAHVTVPVLVIGAEYDAINSLASVRSSVRYFGHACLLVQTETTAVLVDPLMSYESGAAPSRFTAADLPRAIDCVLLTHCHQDHTSIEWLIQLRSRIRNIMFPQNDGGFLPDPSLRLMLRHIGFSCGTALNEFDTIRMGDVNITAVPFFGEHGDLNIRGKTAYLLTVAGKRILIVADSANLDNAFYERLRGSR